VLGGAFQYGYNIAVLNAPAEHMKRYFFTDGDINGTNSNVGAHNSSGTDFNSTNFNSTMSANCTSSIQTVDESADEGVFLWAFTVSIFTVGGIVGSGSVGFMSKKFGRRGAQLVSNILSFVGAVLMGFSKMANSIEMIIIARFLIGVFSGLATGLVPLYISEIAPKHLRGALGVVNQLAITIGILSAQLLGLKEVFGTEELWPILLAFTAVPSAVQLLVLTFLPESPRYLLIDQNKHREAKIALIRLRGKSVDVDDEVEEMQAEADANASSEVASILDVLRDPSIKWQMICISTLHAVQQLCGINAIFFYLNTIFASAGVDEEMQSYASCVVGAVNVIMTIVSVFLSDRAGRRKLLFYGYIISSMFCVLMTISLSLQDDIPWISNLSIASVIGFIVGFAIGPGPIPWIQQTEFFRQSNRPAAGSFGTGLNWTCNFIVALVFPFMQKLMGPFVFVFFLVICIIGTLFTWKYVPETKKKSFEEISALFDKLNNSGGGSSSRGYYDEVQQQQQRHDDRYEI